MVPETPAPGRGKGIIERVVEQATQAASFDRLVVSGLLVILALLILLAFLITALPPAGEKMGEFVLGFFKDLALILAGALANSVRHRGKEGDGHG